MTLPDAKPRKLNILAKINYPGRIIGDFFMGLIICAVLHEGKFFFPWGFVFFHALLWPHIAYGICKVSKDSKKAELRNLLLILFFSFWSLDLYILISSCPLGYPDFCRMHS